LINVDASQTGHVRQCLSLAKPVHFVTLSSFTSHLALVFLSFVELTYI